jgi:hypothetical protein
MQPDVAYTRSGELSIAYQVVGEGPPDVVFIPEWFNNLEPNGRSGDHPSETLSLREISS